MIAVSIVLFVLAVRQMLRASTNIPPHLPTTALVTGGPYRISRNPIYLSLVLLHVGIGIWINSGWIVMSALPCVVILDRWLIEREDSFFAKQAIDERGFSDIGPAHDRQAKALIVSFLFFRPFRLGQFEIQGFHHGFQAPPMGGGHRHWLVHPQACEICQRCIGFQAIDLVGHDQYRPGGTAQHGCYFLVFSSQSVAGTDNEQHHLGLINSLVDLFCGEVIYAFSIADQAAGIHQQAGLATNPGNSILAVTRDAGHVGHQRIPGPG